MFVENKYFKWYKNIISQAKDRVNINIYEKHHIIPRSLGGTDDLSNLVKLSPREHFICHLLLTKSTTGNARYKMTVSISLMIKNTSPTLNRTKVTSRCYDLRVMFSRVSFSDEHKRKLSEKAKINRPRQVITEEHKENIRQSMIGKNVGKILSEETKQKISKAKLGVSTGSCSEETKQKISKANTGRALSEETKQKISNSQLGKKRGSQSDEHKRKISEATKGKKKNAIYSEEERKRRSEAMKLMRAKQKLALEESTLSYT
jgi:hypothetical protein